MNQILPQELQAVVDQVIHAEQRLSYAEPDLYNSYVAKLASATAVSASGRVMVGCDEVRAASVNVAQGNVGERDRFITLISGDYTENMFYAVFKTGVHIAKEGGTEDFLCWVVTLVFKKDDGVWKLVHRHNTRAKP